MFIQIWLPSGTRPSASTPSPGQSWDPGMFLPAAISRPLGCVSMGVVAVLISAWSAKVDMRSGKKQRSCPFCSGKMVCPCKSLAALHPNIAAEWDHNKNAGLLAGDGSPLTPDNCPPGSGKEVWWLDMRLHSWIAKVTTRTTLGHGCPVCNKGGGPPREVSLAVDCPWLVDEWDYENNGT